MFNEGVLNINFVLVNTILEILLGFNSRSVRNAIKVTNASPCTCV